MYYVQKVPDPEDGKFDIVEFLVVSLVAITVAITIALAASYFIHMLRTGGL